MRLFIAVWPPPEVIGQLARLERPTLPGVRWTTEDQWHVTLRFLGEVAAGDLEDVKGALVRLDSVAPARPVTAVAGPVLTRLGQSVLCVPVSGLEPLAVSVGQLTATIGRPNESRPFRGHVTIARTKPPHHPPATGTAFVASWPIGEVTLVASTLHPAGARYTILSRVRIDTAGRNSVVPPGVRGARSQPRSRRRRTTPST